MKCDCAERIGIKIKRQPMEYEYMIPPVKNYDFFEFTKEDAKIYFNWYMEEKGHRIEMLEEYVHNAGVDIDFDYSPESLIPLWRWYETIIVSERRTEEEIKKAKRKGKCRKMAARSTSVRGNDIDEYIEVRHGYSYIFCGSYDTQ